MLKNLRNIIREEISGFEWIDHDRPLDGINFKIVKSYRQRDHEYYSDVYGIEDKGDPYWVSVTWIRPSGVKEESAYMRDAVNKYFKEGDWVPIENNPLNESDDLDWIRDVRTSMTCKNLGKLEKGDIVKVNGNTKGNHAGRNYTFKDSVGMVLNVTNYTGGKKRAYSDTYDYTTTGEFAETLKYNYKVEIAFGEEWGQQGYNADKPKKSFKDKVLDIFKKKDKIKCDRHNCYSFICNDLKTLDIVSLNRLIENINESNDMDWMKKPYNPALDIANALINQTKIIRVTGTAGVMDVRITVPFTKLQFNKTYAFVALPGFQEYIKSTYGIDDNLTISSIINMWSQGVKEKIGFNTDESPLFVSWNSDELADAQELRRQLRGVQDVNESEYDMDWMKKTQPTLNDYIEAKILNVGDIIYLEGSGLAVNNSSVSNNSDVIQVMVNNIPFIIKQINKEISGLIVGSPITYYDVGYLFIKDANENILNAGDTNNFSLIEEDGYLNVTKHIPYKEQWKHRR